MVKMIRNCKIEVGIVGTMTVIEGEVKTEEIGRRIVGQAWVRALEEEEVF